MRRFLNEVMTVMLLATAAIPLFFSQSALASDCGQTSVGFVPLTDLGRNFYQGYEGGLYAAGSNTRPYLHEAAGLALAGSIQPLDSNGLPDPNGRIGFLGVGMSNAEAEFEQFMVMARHDPTVNPAVAFVNGAQHGKASQMAADAKNEFWAVLDGRVADSNLSPLQIQVAWLKEAHAEASLPFPQDALLLQQELIQIVQLLQQRFPNLKIVYLSSRSYAGYAQESLSPEPFAYQSAFAVKWLIQAQIGGDPSLNFDLQKGEVRAPWLTWGPYLWADGLTPRHDSTTWECSDFQADGTHPAASGRIQVARLLDEFLKRDSTAMRWFLQVGNQGDLIP